MAGAGRRQNLIGTLPTHGGFRASAEHGPEEREIKIRPARTLCLDTNARQKKNNHLLSRAAVAGCLNTCCKSHTCSALDEPIPRHPRPRRSLTKVSFRRQDRGPRPIDGRAAVQHRGWDRTPTTQHSSYPLPPVGHLPPRQQLLGTGLLQLVRDDLPPLHLSLQVGHVEAHHRAVLAAGEAHHA